MPTFAPGLRRFRPVDAFNLAFLAFLAVVTALVAPWLPDWPWLQLFHLLAIASICLLRWVHVAGPAWSRWTWRLLGQWYPLVVVPLVFSELRLLIPLVNPLAGDRLLIAWDLALFGAHPSVALQALHWPWLTEFLQYVYSCFYFLPVAVGVALLRGRRGDLYGYFMFLVCYGFYLSYLGYFVIPAVGPARMLADLYRFPLQGVLFFQPIVQLQNALESTHRDCFPSGHTMMTLVTVHFAWRWTRRLSYALVPIGAALIFSTLYLRYHYGVDLLAGAAFYVFAMLTAKPLYQWLTRWFPGEDRE